jgi:hypothetical protein
MKIFNHVEKSTHYVINFIITVPDKRSRILEVVIVGRLLTWVLGIWNGEGMGRVKEGEVSLRVT